MSERIREIDVIEERWKNLNPFSEWNEIGAGLLVTNGQADTRYLIAEIKRRDRAIEQLEAKLAAAPSPAIMERVVAVRDAWENGDERNQCDVEAMEPSLVHAIEALVREVER